MGKIKQWLAAYRGEILIIVILVLTVTAAFQLGRLSIIYGSETQFEIIEP